MRLRFVNKIPVYGTQSIPCKPQANTRGPAMPPRSRGMPEVALSIGQLCRKPVIVAASGNRELRRFGAGHPCLPPDGSFRQGATGPPAPAVRRPAGRSMQKAGALEGSGFWGEAGIFPYLAFTASTTLAKAAESERARSARILRSRLMAAFLRPEIRRE